MLDKLAHRLNLIRKHGTAPASPPTPTFHPFPRLPFELQRQIWLCALSPLVDNAIITVWVSNHLLPYPAHRLFHRGVNTRLLDALGPICHPALPAIRPVHLRLKNGSRITIYVRPRTDILYIPFWLGLPIRFDVDALLADEDNQHSIRTIALNFGDIDTGLRLIRGLGNLRKVYVITGFRWDKNEVAKEKERWNRAIPAELLGEVWASPELTFAEFSDQEHNIYLGKIHGS